jgi:hypothetical protein
MTKQKPPKGQHYLAVAYQSAFEVEGLVARLDLRSSVLQRLAPLAIAKENDLITIRHKSISDPYALEKYLGPVDGAFKAAVGRLEPNVIPNEQDISALLHYIVWQLVRTPGYQRDAKEFHRQYLARFKPDSEEFRVISQLDVKQDIALPTTLDFTKNAFEHLKLHDWHYLQAPAGTSFITGDRPVVVFSPKHWGRAGFGERNTYKYFPVTPRFALLMVDGDRRHPWSIPGRDRVKYLNLRVAHSADRYLFASDPGDLETLIGMSRQAMRIEGERLQSNVRSLIDFLDAKGLGPPPTNIQMWRVDDDFSLH